LINIEQQKEIHMTEENLSSSNEKSLENLSDENEEL